MIRIANSLKILTIFVFSIAIVPNLVSAGQYKKREVLLKTIEMVALVALSPNESSSGIEAAYLAASILKRADPGKIPEIEPAEFDLAVNLKTAFKLGIAIPPDIMKLAGDNIYQ